MFGTEGCSASEMECIPGRFENYEIEFSRMCAMEIDNRQCKKHTMGS